MTEDMRKLGWKPFRLDPCLMSLYDGSGQLVALAAVHVHDFFVCDVGPRFADAFERPESLYLWGEWHKHD